MKVLFPFIVICFLIPIHVFSQNDTEFWFAASEVSNNHGDRPIFFRFSTFDKSAKVTISQPANPGFIELTLNIAANSTRSINMTSYISQIENSAANRVVNKGILISSTALISGYYEVANSNNPELYVLKGKNALGYDFYIPSQFHYFNHNGSESVEIVATQNNTKITINPTADVYGHSKGATFSVTLQRGQCYSLRARYVTEDITLAGTKINSDKPIAVTISDDSIYQDGWDLIGDQIVPVTQIGKEYIVVQGYSNPDDERVYILATQDNTEIDINGDGIIESTLQAGETYWFILFDAVKYFKTSLPVYVYQLTGHPTEAASALIPQINCTGSKQVGFVRTTNGSFSIMLITEKGNETGFILNGNSIPDSHFSDVAGIPADKIQYVYALIEYNDQEIVSGRANLITNNLGEFHLGVLNEVGPSSEFGYYSGYSSLNLGPDTKICEDGELALNAGTDQDSYLWNTGSTKSTISVKDTGYYWVETMKGNCTLYDTIHIARYPAVNVNLGNDTLICHPDTMVLDVSGYGTSFYWQDGSTNAVYDVTQEDHYFVFVQDVNGCVGVDDIFIEYNDIIDIETNIDSITCNGSNDASISVSTGGEDSVLFSLDGIDFQEDNIFEGLAPGEYRIYLKDNTMCQSSPGDLLQITEPEPISVQSVESIQPYCFGDTTGSISIVASGGTGQLFYALNDTNYQERSVFSDLPEGNYSLSIIDVNNCEIAPDNEYSLEYPAELIFDTVIQTNITCHGDADASIQMKAIGGTGPYLYSIDDTSFVDSSLFQTLPAGHYFPSIKDKNNCMVKADTIQIIDPPQLLITNVDTISSNFCADDKNASLSIQAEGGTGQLVFSIYQGGPFQPEHIFDSLMSGTYTICVRDENSCADSIPGFIIDPPQIEITGEMHTGISCFNANDGTITVSAKGGRGMLAYAINDGEFQHSNQFTEIIPGAYQVTVKDTNNCSIQSDKVHNIQNPPEITLKSLNLSHLLCYGYADGQILVEAQGGRGSLTYFLNDTLANVTGEFPGLSSDKYHVKIQDTALCKLLIDTTLYEPQPLIIDSVKQKNISCFSADDGSFLIYAHGGRGSLMYNIDSSAYQDTNYFHTLSGGKYSYSVMDTNACITYSHHPVTIIEPVQLEIVGETVEQISCHDENNGALMFAFQGGRGKIRYLLNDTIASDTSVFYNLPEGEYTFSVEDEKNCSVTSDSLYQIINPLPVSIEQFTSTDISCHNVNDGKFMVSTAGGTGQRTYLLNDTIQYFADTITRLRWGNYSFKAQDENFCVSDTVFFDIDNPLPVKIDSFHVINNKQCAGDSTGIIEIYTSGGNGGYHYSIDSGMTFSNANVFARLGGGDYTILVQDTNLCISETEGTTILPLPIYIDSVAFEPNKCFGDSSGALSCFASGGYDSLFYSIDSVSFGPENSFDSLMAGKYCVYIVDGLNCPAKTDSIEIIQPTKLQFDSIFTQDVTCYGGNNGSATAIISGGTKPYSYFWMDDGASTDSTLHNIVANIVYSVSVADYNGCIIGDSILITEPGDLQFDFVEYKNISCYGGNDGYIMTMVTGGIGNYFFQWDDELQTTDSILHGASADRVYTLTITDENNCMARDSIQLTQPDSLTIQVADSSNITCFGYNDGVASMKSSGGVEPYTYSWSHNIESTGRAFASLYANEQYVVTVTDSNLCQAEISFMLSQPDSIKIRKVQAKDVTCFGYNDGMIEVEATGGTSPLSFLWDDTNNTQKNSLSNIYADITYTLRVEDVNGCKKSKSYSINSPLPLSIDSLKLSDVSCFGVNDGELSVFPSGGQMPYTVFLNDTSTIYNETSVQSLYAGMYLLGIRDSNRCIAYYADSVSIHQPMQLKIDSVQVTDVLCYGDPTGEVLVFSSGGTGNKAYSLGNDEFVNNPFFGHLNSGAYNLIVRDSNMCQDESRFYIDQPEGIQIDFSQIVNSCNGENDGSFTWSIYGGTGEFQQWITDSKGNELSVAEELLPGWYIVHSIDENGCYIQDSVQIVIEDCEFQFTVPNIFTPNGDNLNDVFKPTVKGHLLSYSITIFTRWGKQVYEMQNNFDFTKGWDGKISKSNSLAEPGVYFYLISVTGTNGKSKSINGFVQLMR